MFNTGGGWVDEAVRPARDDSTSCLRAESQPSRMAAQRQTASSMHLERDLDQMNFSRLPDYFRYFSPE